MLTEKRVEVVTVKVSALFNPKDDQFPHFRLVPLEADRQGYLCLLFYIDRNNFLVLESRIKRYAAVRRLSLLQENAPYTVYEISR
ncbi:lipopolysaccharide heptosyltransferase [Neisseria sp. HMSC070A01]|nr:lipopolysaccharide heptosyltransferase [Neisseria sp. HMSC070A01]